MLTRFDRWVRHYEVALKRTFPVHVAETATDSFEKVVSKYGLDYSSTLAESSALTGSRWHAYQFEYRWYRKTLDSRQQGGAAEAELKGLWERFGFRVEVYRASLWL